MKLDKHELQYQLDCILSSSDEDAKRVVVFIIETGFNLPGKTTADGVRLHSVIFVRCFVVRSRHFHSNSLSLQSWLAERVLAIGDSAGDVLREREVREHQLNLDPIERAQLYLDAAADDQLLESAVERTPKILHLVSDDVVAQGRQKRIARLNPAQARPIEMLSEYRRVASGY